MVTEILTYRKVFRLIFILFCLYLMGDAFSRWDGFSHHGSFPEFLPGLALISILWTFVAALTAIFALLITKFIEWLTSAAGKRIRAEHQLLFGCILVLTGKIIYISKVAIFGSGATEQMKIIVLFGVIIASVLLTWLCRNKYTEIQERITPLVILFALLVAVSFPIVIYHTWIKIPQKEATHPMVQSDTADRKLPNIILVTFDALTSLDMSAYGYHRDTTPYIEKWTKNATMFDRAYAAGSTTATTTASLMTGKRLWSHLKYIPIHEGNVFRGKTENIALELKKIGYYNIAITANANAEVNTLGMNDSFDYYTRWTELFEPGNAAEYMSKWLYNVFGEKIRLYEWITMPDFVLEKILAVIPVSKADLNYPTETNIKRFLTALDNKAQEPFFAWIHFVPPHAPYTPPDPFMGMYDKSSVLIKKSEQNKLFSSHFKNPVDNADTRNLFRILRARYDEHIRYCDRSFKDLIGQLQSRGLMKNSVLMLSADHGESFDHNVLEHAGILYEPVTRIPLIIREPGQKTGRIITIPVEQTDISATILDLAGIPTPSWMDGRSLVPLMRGENLVSRPVFSMDLSPNISGKTINKGIIATWETDYKLIYHVNDSGSMLFNLKEDPGELNNLFDKEPKIAKHLENVVLQELSIANERIKSSSQ